MSIGHGRDCHMEWKVHYHLVVGRRTLKNILWMTSSKKNAKLTKMACFDPTSSKQIIFSGPDKLTDHQKCETGSEDSKMVLWIFELLRVELQFEIFNKTCEMLLDWFIAKFGSR